MFKKFKQWREKWTVDHTIDVIIDMLLLVIDVISSPILIVVRIIRYVVIAFATGLFEVLEFWFEELDNSF